MKAWITQNFFMLVSNLLAICLLVTTEQRNEQKSRADHLQHQAEQLQRQAIEWEQAYRDCQASMWMRDPVWLNSSTNLP